MSRLATSPKDGRQIGNYSETVPHEVNEIYENSRNAFESWSKLPLQKRLSYLTQLRDIIVDLQNEITDIIAASTGKTKTDALLTEVMAAAEAIRHIEKEAPTILAKEKVKTPVHFMGKSSYIVRKPRGSVLIISPWNFPFQLAISPIVEALVSGNTVIIKPSEETSMVGVLLQHLMNLFPENVVQVVLGGKELGQSLTKGKPDYIHFTGSEDTGKSIQAQASKNLTPTTLELGGKDAMIVYEDANLNRAAKAAVWGAFNNSGQICLSIERVYVQAGIYNQFLQKVKQETAKIRQGHSDDADVGAMTTKRQVNKVKKQVQEALDEGAVLETGKAPGDSEENSSFIEPVILTGIREDMKIMKEETFGPVMPIAVFDTEEEAVDLANNTKYGLGASVFTQDLNKGERAASQLITGSVSINDVMTTVANFYLPYGGVKQSGIGKYHGSEGIRSFCIETSVMANKGTSDNEINWFPIGKYSIFKDLVESYWGKQRNWKIFVQSYMNLIKK
ncbi:aldehyde dehydrogenase family protein [Alteribacillus sp. JSM 102045]|uniref:aldehyde dehydrogenase family protein n=1 Tax=Alteribacillus sp. JSM 102045 TaxID=1562101 RepID=UPI0035C21022